MHLLHEVAAALKKRGFEAVAVASSAEAREIVAKEAEKAKTVGWGGSESLKDSGIREMLEKSGKKILDHELIMDLFLLSANALTTDGRIVNIDGRGNRVAASIAGPKKTIYVIGKNKIVEGGIDAALSRIHSKACGPNCRRLGKKTPCAINDVCLDCDSPDRICKVTAIFDRCPTGMPTLVILVDEDLGY